LSLLQLPGQGKADYFDSLLVQLYNSVCQGSWNR